MWASVRIILPYVNCGQVNTSGEVSASYKSLREALGKRKEWPELTGSPHSPPPSGSQSSDRDEKDEKDEKDCELPV